MRTRPTPLLRAAASGAAALLLASAAPAAAQPAPHVTGTVEVDLSRGMLTGDLCTSRIPPLDTLSFLLNRGLTIRSVRDSTGRALSYGGFYNGKMVGEGVLYTVTDTARAPGPLCVSYVGAYPVYDRAADEYNVFDFKGWLAFNGRTFRAAEQSKWYPVLFAPARDQAFEPVTYRVRVRCAECRTLYLNGAAPAAGPEAEFLSDHPAELLLYAGDYDARRIGSTYYLDSDVSPASAAVLSAAVDSIAAFYEEMLGVPYGHSLVLMEHDAVERYGPQRNWGFVTWPTMAYAGVALDSWVTEGGVVHPIMRRFLAHEMGHYYFGTVLPPRGLLGQFFLESAAEYLSLKVWERSEGTDAYRELLGTYYREVVAGPDLPRLHAVPHADSTLAQSFRYRYGPLLLASLEEEIGRERVAKVLAAALTAPPERVRDYAFLREAVLASGVAEESWRGWEERCVRPAPAASCLRERFERPAPAAQAGRD